MMNLVTKRLAMALFVALVVSIIGFLLLRFSGDLARELAGEEASAKDIADVARLYGLDRSLFVQYLDWIAAVLSGDLGKSLFTGQPVAELIETRIGSTAALAFGSLIFALIAGVPLGVIAASRPNTWIDRTAAVLAVSGQAIPNFWFGLMMMLLFGVWLQLTPISGDETAAHFILPIFTLGLSVMPQFVRVTRSGMIDALGADYVRTARAKGLRRRRVLFRHALRNAVLPVVSLAAVSLGFLLGGSVIVESVFGIHGLGLLAYESIQRNDFPVVQTVIVFLSFVYVALTLIADLVNAWLDPRIRTS